MLSRGTPGFYYKSKSTKLRRGKLKRSVCLAPGRPAIVNPKAPNPAAAQLKRSARLAAERPKGEIRIMNCQ